MICMPTRLWIHFWKTKGIPILKVMADVKYEYVYWNIASIDKLIN